MRENENDNVVNIFTFAERVCFLLCLFLCGWLVGQQDYTKTTELISKEIGCRMDRGPD